MILFSRLECQIRKVEGALLMLTKFFFEDIKIGGDSFSFGSHKVECKSIDSLVSSLKIKKLALLGITIPGEITAKVLEGAK